MADWQRIHKILDSAERTVISGIATAHTLTTPEFIELQHLLLDARYECEAAAPPLAVCLGVKAHDPV